jgi:signal transduction histidine kinase
MRASRGIEDEGAGSAAGAGRLAVRGIVAESAADLAFALLQATDYGILMTDPQGRDLVGNRRFGELFGVDVGGVVEMSRDEVREAMRARLRDPDGFFARVDAIYRSPDWSGEEEVEIVWPETRVLRRYTAPVPDAEGRSVGRIWTFLDITETRRLQTQLARTAGALETQVQERTRDLRSTTEVLQAMTQVVSAVGHAGGLQALIQRAAEELRPLFGHHCAAVLLWDARDAEFRGVFAPPAEAGPAAALTIPAGQEPDLERALREMPPESPVRLREFQGSDSGLLLTRGCGAGRLVPLIIEGEARGVVLWGSSGIQALGRSGVGGPTKPKTGPPLSYQERPNARTPERLSTPERLNAERRDAQIESVAALVGIAIETHLLQARLADTLEELRQAQAQIVQTERVAAAATLATSVAHDIRNIITPLAVELGMLPVEAGEAVQVARDQLNRLAVLTQRLLAIARPARVARGHFCLVELLRRLEPLLQTQAGLENCTLVWRRHTRQADIEADDSQIEQVILNLVLNGIQAMAPQGGALEISLEHGGDIVRLSVRDHGAGVPPEARETIFRPFYTTKCSGAGLGLYSSRRIAEEHGGRIEVMSPDEQEGGRGAVFSLILPAAGPPG